MPGCLSHSLAISGLRGKLETSISQGDFLSGRWGFWKGCHGSCKAAQSFALWSQPRQDAAAGALADVSRG